MTPQVFEKHPVEKRGSIILMGLFLWFSSTTAWIESHIQSRGIVGFILFFAVVYARYERVTLHDTHIEYRKLYFIIPQKNTIIAKHINDIQTTTLLPGLERIQVMTSNDEHIMLQYFEHSKELYSGLINLLTRE